MIKIEVGQCWTSKDYFTDYHVIEVNPQHELVLVNLITSTKHFNSVIYSFTYLTDIADFNKEKSIGLKFDNELNNILK